MQLGEEGLKAGGGGGGPGGPGGGGARFHFQGGDPFEMFRTFFGDSDPFGGGGGGGGQRVRFQFQSGGGGGGENMFHGFGGGGGGGQRAPRRKQASALLFGTNAWLV